jgi:hypothetical protein
MSHLLIIGAKSDIAKAVAKEYAQHQTHLILAGRRIGELENFANDLRIRYGIDVSLKELDLSDTASHEAFYEALKPKPNGVVVAAGYMVEQSLAQRSLDETLKTISVNFTGAVSLLNIVATDFERKKAGFIVGISSVAGDRGRKANYIYGAAKAGFSAYLSGLRNRLFENGVHVLTVKPGFVNTKMTQNLELPKKLTIEPSEVAKAIFNAQKSGKDVLYTKWIWRYIMLIIKHIPEFMFKKMSL